MHDKYTDFQLWVGKLFSFVDGEICRLEDLRRTKIGWRQKSRKKKLTSQWLPILLDDTATVGIGMTND